MYTRNGGGKLGTPVRVLHVVVNMNRGGAETLIMNLYRNIDRAKVQFDFLTCKEGVFDSEIKAMGGKIYRIPYVSDVGHRGYIRELNQFFYRHSDYQIVHSHLDKMSGLVLRAARKAKIPNRIAHSHNTSSEGGKIATLYKWYVGLLIDKNANHLFACSQLAARWLYASKSRSSTIIKNGIEFENFSFSKETRKEIRKELGINDKTFVFGHVGRFAKQKNHLFLIEVFSDFVKIKKDSLLLLAGDGPLRSEIERKVKKLQIEKNVKFLGIRSDVDHVLQAFDVFVFPSFHEGLPVTLIEAQAAGLTCFISDNITSEIDLGMKLIHQLSLEDKTSWIDYLMAFSEKSTSRYQSSLVFTLKGYNILQSARRLEENYLTMGGEKNEEINHLHPNVQ